MGREPRPLCALVLGFLIALPGLALIAAGGTGFWLNAQRDVAGFISTPTQTISSSPAAVTIENVHLDIDRIAAYYLSSRDLGHRCSSGSLRRARWTPAGRAGARRAATRDRNRLLGGRIRLPERRVQR